MDGLGLCIKIVDRVVAFLSTLWALPSPGVFTGFSQMLELFEFYFSAVLFHGHQRQGQRRHDAFGDVTQVLEQVPTIRHLAGVLGYCLSTVHKRSGTVPAYDFNGGMCPQPGSQNIGASLGEA